MSDTSWSHAADILEIIQRRGSGSGESAAEPVASVSLQAVMEQGPLDGPVQHETSSDALPSASLGLSDEQLKGTVAEPLR